MNANRSASGQYHRNARSLRRALPMLAIAWGLTLSAASQACSLFGTRDEKFIRFDIVNESQADIELAVAGSGRAEYDGCGNTPVAAEVSANFSGLTYVRDVTVYAGDGPGYISAPAFAFDSSPTSPLLAMVHVARGSNGGDTTVSRAFDPRTTLRNPGSTSDGGYRTYRLVSYLISRGGLMTDVSTRTLGTFTTTLPGFPSAGAATLAVELGFQFRPTTCSLTDPPTIALSDIRPQDLPATGSTAADQDFDVQFNCNGAGFNLYMTLSDANDLGNTSSRLEPSSGSTAQGVRIELLRAGAPVSLGAPWSQGTSTGAAQSVTLTARYHREAGTYSAGTIGGQATLVLDHN